MLARQTQREGARAAEEIGDPPRAGERRRRAVGERPLARCGRLQEAAGRRRRQHVAEQDLRRPAFDDRLAMDGKPRQIEPLGGGGELAPRQVVGRARAAQIEIEPAERRRRLDVERLADAAHRRGERVGGGNRAGEAGREQRAGVDGDDVVGARAHEADLLAAVDEARVEGRAAAALAMGVDQRARLRRRRPRAATPRTTPSRFHVA